MITKENKRNNRKISGYTYKITYILAASCHRVAYIVQNIAKT